MRISKNDMKAARLASSGFILPVLINDRPIMRYISFYNLMDIFVYKRLTLTWAIDFKDTLEGCITRTQSRKQLSKIHDLHEERASVGESLRSFQVRKRNTYISCWCRNPRETNEMWERYVPDQYGVAIYSSTAILAEFVEENERPDNLELDWAWKPIEYVEISENFPEIDFNNMFDFKSKREFSVEEEIRLIASDVDGFGKETEITTSPRREDLNEQAFQKLPRKERVSLPVDPNKLIQKIIISPRSDGKFHEDVVSLCNWNNFGNVLVQSSLSF
jgi:hypothetical protein